MATRQNALGQAIGDEVPGWVGAKRPPRFSVTGRFCQIEPLDEKKHLTDLFDAFRKDAEGKLWTYMFVGPFADIDSLRAWLRPACASEDPMFYAIVDLESDKALGLAALMRIKPEMGVIEVGNIAYSTALQRTAAATEAMFLLMTAVFDDLGYRRYEWKCDSLNAASRSAAERLGFRYDGLFRQAIVYKGRNRDTAWYSILDRDWPALKSGFCKWLDKDNFDDGGRQKKPLQQFLATEGVRVS